MFEKDIENAFTAKVAQYLADGYVFNLTTMNGSQGEDGKVDLRKGNEIIRILLDRKYEGDFEIFYLLVGRNTDRLSGGWSDIIWNEHLEEIECIDFYVIGKRKGGEYYGTKEEAEAAQKKRIARCGRKLMHVETELSEAYKEIAYRILKKRDCFKSIKKSNITSVEQIEGFFQNRQPSYQKRIFVKVERRGRVDSEVLYSAWD